jgi:hypothetical protein
VAGQVALKQGQIVEGEAAVGAGGTGVDIVVALGTDEAATNDVPVVVAAVVETVAVIAVVTVVAIEVNVAVAVVVVKVVAVDVMCGKADECGG